MTDDDNLHRSPDARRMTFDEMASRAQYEWDRAEKAEAEVADLSKRLEIAQQERDEAYERLKPLASGAEALWPSIPDQFEVIVRVGATPLFSLKVGEVRAARDLVRRLAGPEKIAAANDGEERR